MLSAPNELLDNGHSTICVHELLCFYWVWGFYTYNIVITKKYVYLFIHNSSLIIKVLALGQISGSWGVYNIYSLIEYLLLMG
jgi:hypothetical protein